MDTNSNMEENDMRREWDLRNNIEPEKNEKIFGIKDFIGLILISTGVFFGIWIILEIRDLLNGTETGLIKAMTQEAIKFQSGKTTLSFPSRPVAVVISGGLLFVASMVALGFVTQGVNLMHLDMKKILKSIKDLKNDRHIVDK